MVSKSIVCWFWLCIQYCWSLSAVLSTVFVFCLLCVFSPTTVFVFLPQQQGHSPYPTVHTELFIHSLGGQMAGGHTQHYRHYQHCHCCQRYHHYPHVQTLLGTVSWWPYTTLSFSSISSSSSSHFTHGWGEYSAIGLFECKSIEGRDL